MSEISDKQASGSQPRIAAGSVTYSQSKVYAISVTGGSLLLCLTNAVLFDGIGLKLLFVAPAALLMMALIAVFLFPPKLVLSKWGLKRASFGFLVAEFPWSAVETISMFRTSLVQTLNSRPVGGRRAIGFKFRRGFEGRVRPRKGAYGYGAFVESAWNAPLDVIAEQCLAYWRAAGGHGDLVDTFRQPPSGRLVEGFDTPRGSW